MKTKVNLPLGIGLKDGGCPYGTVPIMRIDEDDLARAKMNSKIYLSNTNEEPGHHYAILRTKPDPTRKINGIQASFDAVNTKGVDGSQYSSFRMMLSNGPDSIKTGLTVNPALFKDNKTRLFTHVVMDGRTQCFNQQCPAYIQLNSQIPLGWPVDNTSTIGGDQYAVKLQVIKEYISTGPNSKQFVWTLRFELENTILGFWPTTIFSRLSEFGNQVDWGGEVYSPLDLPSPAMGTGIPPRKNKVDTAYSTFSWFVAVSYQDSQSIIFESPSNTEVYESDPEAYNIVDVGNVDKFYGYLIVYDGPGGIIKSH
ncbi:hypothetical protein CIPAW_02G077800 [Carya illinoinensis]|uniref:Neprosin PEP catalytic domain-containing protein n=2 Tax=Carya illinoinensis TaxID=32201 RepID=A0A8T1RE57_CARIL|nr:hypothetical protein CIPAW_02G077800 [Carya illinoinensis]